MSTHSIRGRLPGNPLPRRVSVPAKFVLSIFVMQVTWLLVLTTLSSGQLPEPSGAPPSGSSIQLAQLIPEPKTVAFLLVVWIAPASIATVVYSRLPDQTVDVFHRFGKAAALFAAVNITISVGILITDVTLSDPILGMVKPQQALHAVALDVFMGWLLSSLFLPGAYVGALVAARWSR